MTMVVGRGLFGVVAVALAASADELCARLNIAPSRTSGRLRPSIVDRTYKSNQSPHQGRKECARRLRQLARGVIR